MYYVWKSFVALLYLGTLAGLGSWVYYLMSQEILPMDTKVVFSVAGAVVAGIVTFLVWLFDTKIIGRVIYIEHRKKKCPGCGFENLRVNITEIMPNTPDSKLITEITCPQCEYKERIE